VAVVAAADAVLDRAAVVADAEEVEEKGEVAGARGTVGALLPAKGVAHGRDLGVGVGLDLFG